MGTFASVVFFQPAPAILLLELARICLRFRQSGSPIVHLIRHPGSRVFSFALKASRSSSLWLFRVGLFLAAAFAAAQSSTPGPRETHQLIIMVSDENGVAVASARVTL